MSEKQTGGISVNTENIFPVIKKWLYSEKDIFLREIVSNATDAITKLSRLISLGEATDDGEAPRITVSLDKVAKTLTVEDNGIGMTEEELKRYICSIALSGAVDFIQKYEGEGDGAKGGIIGHFGLGFYSAFMVSDRVEIHTRSHTGAPAVHWSCTAEGEYEIEASDRATRGTEVIMHVTEEESAYLDAAKIKGMLEKYCAFMPAPIYFDDGEEHTEEPSPINDTTPLWKKAESDCGEEDYKAFYQKVFADYREPLFHIHLNADYPLNFKGILYFPRINTSFDSLEGEIKLFYNQVFVADNIKEIVPDYLLMLKGVIDCPELPLNVSRSYLQTNKYVARLSAYIVKKVGDKLISLCNNEREKYEGLWDDLKTFVQYACLRDGKFYDRVKNALLLKLTDGTYVTPAEYLEKTAEGHKTTVYYTTDPAMQAQYVSLYEKEGIRVAVVEGIMETQFLSLLESGMEGVKFLRVDASTDALKAEGGEEDKALSDLFREASGKKDLEVLVVNLKSRDVPAIFSIPEEMRRMQEQLRMYRLSMGEDGAPDLPLTGTLTVNSASPLILKIKALAAEGNAERATQLAAYVFRLSLLGVQKMNAEEMKQFLEESYRILTDLA